VEFIAEGESYHVAPRWMIKDYFTKRLDNALTFGVLDDRQMPEPQSEQIIVKRQERPPDPTAIDDCRTTFTYGYMLNERLQNPTMVQEETVPNAVIPIKTFVPLQKIAPLEIPIVRQPTAIEEDRQVSNVNLQSQQTDPVGSVIVETSPKTVAASETPELSIEQEYARDVASALPSRSSNNY
jgi:hypothetical protein